MGGGVCTGGIGLLVEMIRWIGWCFQIFEKKFPSTGERDWKELESLKRD